MKYLKIQNDGLLDIRLVALMGGTTKSNDKFKIGQFGTGLKYTLAFLFRNNLHFRIFAGLDEIEIGLEEETIREEKFEIITINGHRTSITTKMGEDWEPWMIIRELWCNALDEGGAFHTLSYVPQGEEGKTNCYIQIDSQIQAVLDQWDKYFIHEHQPMWSNETYSLYPGGHSLRLYKNGVLIMEKEKTPTVFSYDIKNASINELRQYQGLPNWDMCWALAKVDEGTANYFLSTVTPNHYEGGDMSMDNYQTFGEGWIQAIGNAKLIHDEAVSNIKARGIELDVDRLLVVPKNVFRALTKQFEHVSALTIASKIGTFYKHHSEDCENMIKKGLVILEACHYPMHPELTFQYGFFEDKTVMVRVNLNDKTIYVNNTILQQPLTEVVSMLIEENEHFNTGFADCSRQFQDHIFKLYTRQLLVTHGIEI